MAIAAKLAVAIHEHGAIANLASFAIYIFFGDNTKLYLFLGFGCADCSGLSRGRNPQNEK